MDTQTTLQTITAVIYARTACRANGIEPQIAALETLAASSGCVAVATFADWGVSGNTAERAGLQDLLSYLEGHPATYLLISNVCRLARDPQLLIQILDRLSLTGVQIITLDGSRVEDGGRLFKELVLPT
jgi:DNA invertase Pin-like site-specific DNA recombinase